MPAIVKWLQSCAALYKSYIVIEFKWKKNKAATHYACGMEKNNG